MKRLNRLFKNAYYFFLVFQNLLLPIAGASAESASSMEFFLDLYPIMVMVGKSGPSPHPEIRELWSNQCRDALLGDQLVLEKLVLLSDERFKNTFLNPNFQGISVYESGKNVKFLLDILHNLSSKWLKSKLMTQHFRSI